MKTLLTTITLLLLPFLASAQAYATLVELPGVTFGGADGFEQFINSLYILSITIAALLAVIKIVIAGVKYMMTDIVTSKGEAKKDIQGALLGLLIVLSAVLILTIINPQLTNVTFDPEPSTPPPFVSQATGGTNPLNPSDLALSVTPADTADGATPQAVCENIDTSRCPIAQGGGTISENSQFSATNCFAGTWLPEVERCQVTRSEYDGLVRGDAVGGGGNPGNPGNPTNPTSPSDPDTIVITSGTWEFTSSNGDNFESIGIFPSNPAQETQEVNGETLRALRLRNNTTDNNLVLDLRVQGNDQPLDLFDSIEIAGETYYSADAFLYNPDGDRGDGDTYTIWQWVPSANTISAFTAGQELTMLVDPENPSNPPQPENLITIGVSEWGNSSVNVNSYGQYHRDLAETIAGVRLRRVTISEWPDRVSNRLFLTIDALGNDHPQDLFDGIDIDGVTYRTDDSSLFFSNTFQYDTGEAYTRWQWPANTETFELFRDSSDVTLEVIFDNQRPIVSITSPDYPGVDIISNGLIIGLPNNSIALEAQAEDLDGEIVTTDWGGNGSYRNSNFTNETGLTTTATFITEPRQRGLGNVSFRAFDDDGAVTSASFVLGINPVIVEINFLALYLNETDTIYPEGSYHIESNPGATQEWVKVSGPNGSTDQIINSTTANPEIGPLIEGEYVFRYTVTGTDGESASDELFVTVYPEKQSETYQMIVEGGDRGFSRNIDGTNVDGSISPGTYNGQDILQIEYSGGMMGLQLLGVVPQNFFSSLIINGISFDPSNVDRFDHVQDAYSRWSWSNDEYDEDENGGVRLWSVIREGSNTVIIE